MSQDPPDKNLKNISPDLQRVIEIFSKTASNITSDIEEAIKIAGSEEELKKILKDTLKNTKDGLVSLLEKLDKESR